MSVPFLLQKPFWYCLFAAVLLSSVHALSMDCTREPSTHVKLAEGDQSSATHLRLSRKLPADAAVDLDICDGDLIIKGGKNELLHLSVDFEKGTPKQPVSDYLQALDVTTQSVDLKLYLPKSPRAKVTIIVPAKTPNMQLNLVRGDLAFQTDRISGERRINVVSGHVELLANADSYSTLHASLLLGSYHDHRHGNDHAHGAVSKSLSGTGTGSIDINVVKGSLDLKAWD